MYATMSNMYNHVAQTYRMYILTKHLGVANTTSKQDTFMYELGCSTSLYENYKNILMVILLY